MPQHQKRSDYRVGRSRILEEQPAPTPVSIPRMIGAGAARVAGGLYPFGGPIGAGLAGASEMAAQKIERGWDAPINPYRVGVEGGIGMVPVGKYIQGAKWLASMLKTGAMAGGGEAAREVSEGEDINPVRVGLATAAGGATGGILGRFLPAATPSKGLRVLAEPSTTTPPRTFTEMLVDKMKAGKWKPEDIETQAARAEALNKPGTANIIRKTAAETDRGTKESYNAIPRSAATAGKLRRSIEVARAEADTEEAARNLAAKNIAGLEPKEPTVNVSAGYTEEGGPRVSTSQRFAASKEEGGPPAPRPLPNRITPDERSGLAAMTPDRAKQMLNRDPEELVKSGELLKDGDNYRINKDFDKRPPSSRATTPAGGALPEKPVVPKPGVFQIVHPNGKITEVDDAETALAAVNELGPKARVVPPPAPKTDVPGAAPIQQPPPFNPPKIVPGKTAAGAATKTPIEVISPTEVATTIRGPVSADPVADLPTSGAAARIAESASGADALEKLERQTGTNIEALGVRGTAPAAPIAGPMSAIPKLQALGYTADDIGKMSAGDADTIIKAGVRKGKAPAGERFVVGPKGTAIDVDPPTGPIKAGGYSANKNPGRAPAAPIATQPSRPTTGTPVRPTSGSAARATPPPELEADRIAFEAARKKATLDGSISNPDVAKQFGLLGTALKKRYAEFYGGQKATAAAPVVPKAPIRWSMPTGPAPAAPIAVPAATSPAPPTTLPAKPVPPDLQIMIDAAKNRAKILVQSKQGDSPEALALEKEIDDLQQQMWKVQYPEEAAELAAEKAASKGRKPSKGGTTLGSGLGGIQGILDIAQRHPAFVARLGLGAAGAAGGAIIDPLDDPFSSAAVGAGLMMGTPELLKGLHSLGVNMQQLPELAQKLQSPTGLKEVGRDLYHLVPHIQRFNYLMSAKGLPANAFVGPYGSAFFGALTKGLAGDRRGWAALRMLTPVNVVKHMGRARVEALDMIQRAEAGDPLLRAELGGEALAKLPSSVRTTLTSPAVAMTSGDVGVRNILKQAGFSDEEAREITLTAEPFIESMKKLANLRRGKSSPLLETALPFVRTPANILEQGGMRIPGIGFAVQAAREKGGAAAIPLQEQAWQQAIGTVMFFGGYGAGSNMSPDQARIWRRYISNAAGQYSLLATVGFALGQTHARGQGWASRRNLEELGRAFPFPTADPFMDVAQGINQGSIPRNVVPAILTEFQPASQAAPYTPRITGTKRSDYRPRYTPR